ncbi:MAG: ribonuclease P protein component [Patescibacteria group bacterium]
MLKRVNRLSVLKRSKGEKTISSLSFTIKYLKREDDGLKFAFIISKRIDKKAVIRNKIKRNLAKGIEEILAEIVLGYNLIFIPKKEILEKNQEEIVKEVKEVFKLNNLLK